MHEADRRGGPSRRAPTVTFEQAEEQVAAAGGGYATSSYNDDRLWRLLGDDLRAFAATGDKQLQLLTAAGINTDDERTYIIPHSLFIVLLWREASRHVAKNTLVSYANAVLRNTNDRLREQLKDRGIDKYEWGFDAKSKVKDLHVTIDELAMKFDLEDQHPSAPFFKQDFHPLMTYLLAAGGLTEKNVTFHAIGTLLSATGSRISSASFLRWVDAPFSRLSPSSATPAAATSDESPASAQQPRRRTQVMHALESADGEPLAPLPPFLEQLRDKLKDEPALLCRVTYRFEKGNAIAAPTNKKRRDHILLLSSMEQNDILFDAPFWLYYLAHTMQVFDPDEIEHAKKSARAESSTEESKETATIAKPKLKGQKTALDPSYPSLVTCIRANVLHIDPKRRDDYVFFPRTHPEDDCAGLHAHKRDTTDKRRAKENTWAKEAGESRLKTFRQVYDLVARPFSAICGFSGFSSHSFRRGFVTMQTIHANQLTGRPATSDDHITATNVTGHANITGAYRGYIDPIAKRHSIPRDDEPHFEVADRPCLTFSALRTAPNLLPPLEELLEEHKAKIDEMLTHEEIAYVQRAADVLQAYPSDVEKSASGDYMFVSESVSEKDYSYLTSGPRRLANSLISLAKAHCRDAVKVATPLRPAEPDSEVIAAIKDTLALSPRDIKKVMKKQETILKSYREWAKKQVAIIKKQWYDAHSNLLKESGKADRLVACAANGRRAKAKQKKATKMKATQSRVSHTSSAPTGRHITSVMTRAWNE